MFSEPGARVVAIKSTDKDTVHLYGYSVYEGNKVPDVTAEGTMANMLRKAGISNPSIRLDSGKIVYGCECWWQSEDQAKKTIGDRKIIDVDIDDDRKKKL
jgi:hypothetical protein